MSDRMPVDAKTCYRCGVKIESGKRVTLKIELAVKGGATLEKSTVEFVAGTGKMLAGLEVVLVGLEKGATRSGTLEAKDAFGNPAMHPLKQMPRSEFPAGVKVAPGERMVAAGVNGMNVIMQVESVQGDSVQVRLIHPLAEKAIDYKFEVVQVTDPRPPPMPAAAMRLQSEE